MALQIDKQDLYNLLKEIEAQDEILDAASGGQSAGRRAILNQLVKDKADPAKQLSDQAVTAFTKILDEQGVEAFIGVFEGFRKNLAESFDPKVSEYLDQKVAETKDSTPKVSDEQVAEVSETRRNLVKKFKGLKEILGLMGEDVEDVPEPKRRTGAHGKRGPRAISLYTWSVNGERMAPDSDTLAGVAAANEYENAKELRDALNAAGISTKTPPDSISFTLKNGKTLTGVKKAVDSEDESSEDDDEDEDSDDES